MQSQIRYQSNYEKQSIDGDLGIRTRGCVMEGADESTGLGRFN